MSIGAPDNAENMSKAQNLLESLLVKADGLPAEAVEMVKFRLAKCLEAQEQEARALELYEQIIVAYTVKRDSGRIPAWRYYVESVFEAGRILTQRGDRESLRRAVLFYEDLAKSNITKSREAQKKAEEIRSSF